MIDCIILSKNRACQLELLIRSIRKNFKEIDVINVLYTSSNADFEAGYEKLYNMTEDLTWFKEMNFASNYLSILGQVKTKYMMNFCDDNVVINDLPVGELLNEYDKNPKIISASLRLNTKYIYCHPAETYFSLPKFISTFKPPNNSIIILSP